MEISQHKQQVVEYLDYQKSDPANKMTCSSEKHSCKGFQISIETLMKEINAVNTEKKNESRDEPYLIAHFAILRQTEV